ncbi:hypothetical protein L210DRAFT_2151355 [Boletus edulis BED1]|uniref:Uncharacterized protein n=1 Tax=Boletus edulis BED1 TaxID=1328754 RepID=A0AAD4GEH4_BOLED|nr:hypothetical protein L210DRAFT_2151355 [Boletus edulis BED1]
MDVHSFAISLVLIRHAHLGFTSHSHWYRSPGMFSGQLAVTVDHQYYPAPKPMSFFFCLDTEHTNLLFLNMNLPFPNQPTANYIKRFYILSLLHRTPTRKKYPR